jgi:hypothetical protein
MALTDAALTVQPASQRSVANRNGRDVPRFEDRGRLVVRFILFGWIFDIVGF